MDFIFILITLLWLLEFIIFPSLNKPKSKTNSFSIIMFGIIIIVVINGMMFFKSVLILDNFILKVGALIIYTLGIILRYWSLILLGKNFSREVDVRRDQQLVSIGTYRLVRHPLYLGLFLLTIAVPLYTGNLIMFVIAIIIMFKAISIRIIEEERLMEQVIGERYVKWKDKRYKFIPFIY